MLLWILFQTRAFEQRANKKIASANTFGFGFAHETQL